MKRSVAIVRHNPGAKSVEEAISLCNGAKDLKPYSKVMIKPNVVIGGKIYKPFLKGTVVNADIIEEIITFLRDFGCSDICIGEGSVLLPELGATTETAFETAGITELAKRYQIKLLDFYQHPFKKVEIGGKQVEVSVPVLESDYIINVPVLKTHLQTKVSLSIKNMKGSLNFPSKKNFHGYDLEKYIAMLGAYLKPHLNIVDGLYTINYGPVSLESQQVGIIIAGTDSLAVDMVGSSILGQDFSDVEHIVEYAKITNGSLDMDTIDVRGNSIDDVKVKTSWDRDWGIFIPELFKIKGVKITQSGKTLCSSCGFAMAQAFIMTFNKMAGKTFKPVEFCVGSVASANGQGPCFLLGKCAIESNKDLVDAIKIKGCPPDVNNFHKIVSEFLDSSVVE
ncbi:MAG: DUF362 domain-containing protein [Deltaproteobacteria bacterium]|nr:DUF362 domain-containing protein [Deltaproteobacteria bacterium]